MKKLAALFLTLLFASTASAQVISNPTTNARMDGLGVNNWQIEDDFNIWINPAQLSNYKNTVYGELGTYAGTGTSITPSTNNDRTDAWGGMNMDVSYGQWGVYLGRPYDGALDLLPGTAPTSNWVDLIYASKGMPLGFYVGYVDRSTEDKVANTKDEASEWNIGAGGIFGPIEAAINIGMPSSKCDGAASCGGAGPPPTTTEDDASMNWALMGRYHLSHTGGKYLVTGLLIHTDATIDGAPGDTNSNLLVLDFTCNQKPNADTLLIAGIALTWEDGKALGTDFNSMSLPLTLAVEHKTFKKVQTRIGLSKAIYQSSEIDDVADTLDDELGSDTTAVDRNAAEVSMGLGWMVADNLMIDAVINQDVLFTGSYVVSGVPESLNSKLSATYRFK